MTPQEPVQNHEIKSILLLDDDPDLAFTMKALLESRNFVVTAVTNGAEGLREILAFDFDVILCDLMMPTMPGDMFYLAVQRSRPHLCKRFIFITGQQNNVRVEEFLRTVDGVALFKPVHTEDLIRAISLVLKRPEDAPS